MKANKLATLLAMATAVAVTYASAQASSDDYEFKMQPGQTAQSFTQITKTLNDKGYQVTRLKRDDGVYEAYVRDANGVRLELKIHPATGKILKRELED